MYEDLREVLNNFDRLAKVKAKPRPRNHAVEQLERYKSMHGGKTPMQVFVDEKRDLLRKIDMNAGIARRRFAQPGENHKALLQARVLATVKVKNGHKVPSNLLNEAHGKAGGDATGHASDD